MKYLAILLAVVCCGQANAQLFSRFGRAQVSSCPGGVCPTTTVYSSPAVRSPGHWSYPGDIDSHLERDHGVSTAGMSRQQKLDLHDSLHEGTAPAVRRSSSVVVRGAYQSVGGTVSYGSTGSSVKSYGSTGSAAASSQASEAMGFGQRKKSLQVIIKAVEQAKAEGLIDAAQCQAIQKAARSPRMLARIEDLILEKAQSSGAYSFPMNAQGDIIAAGVNWEAIGDFILKIAPIIFKLIEMFAIFEQAGDLQGMAMIEANLDYLATIHWQAKQAC